MHASDCKLQVRDLGKSFILRDKKEVVALDAINLDILDGKFVCLIGASGCGKTTLLRIIGGFEQASHGHVDIARRGKPNDLVTATVFQNESVFPWLDVQANVEYGLKILGVPSRERREVSDHFIDRVGLDRFKNAYPAQLSGGMRQRVAVARAFAAGPEVLLMDEPFGALDEQTRVVLQDELLHLWNEHRRTVIFVTHSLDEAITLADQIVVLSPRPGRIRAIIDVNIDRPRKVGALRANPEYGRLYEELWSLIQPDIGASEGRKPDEETDQEQKQ